MTRSILLFVLLSASSGCASLGLGSTGGGRGSAQELWNGASDALARYDFERAESLYTRLATDHPETVEGRESVFYLGAIHLDPRNPDWDPAPAQARLEEYLANREGGPRLYRYLEAQTLHEIARQLNLPPESRVAGLQPEERVVTVERRVVVPARQSRELSAEVSRLREQIAERDARIAQQQEELERIRRTLTTPARQ